MVDFKEYAERVKHAKDDNELQDILQDLYEEGYDSGERHLLNEP